MKKLIALSILFCAIAMPALAELTDADLNKIRLIVKEEVQKEVTSSETRMKEYVDLKFKNVDSQFESISKQLSIYQWGLGILSLFVIDRLQKQNEVLMLPAPQKKRSWLDRLTRR